MPAARRLILAALLAMSVAGDEFAVRVVGISDGDTLAALREARAARRGMSQLTSCFGKINRNPDGVHSCR